MFARYMPLDEPPLTQAHRFSLLRARSGIGCNRFKLRGDVDCQDSPAQAEAPEAASSLETKASGSSGQRFSGVGSAASLPGLGGDLRTPALEGRHG